MDAASDRENTDVSLLSWVGVWSVVEVLAIAAVLDGRMLGTLSSESQTIIGFLLGSLSAAWIAVGTWLYLIDITTCQPRPLIRLRIVVALAWLANIIVFVFVTWQSPVLFGRIALMVVLGISGPLIVWHWNRRRISRLRSHASNQHSIGQLLWVTSIFAIAIAVFNVLVRSFEMTNAFSALAVSSGVMWLMLLSILLGKWWWMILFSTLMMIAQLIGISSMVDMNGPAPDTEISVNIAMIAGFYLSAILFLLLLRSSGHRFR
ncbi:hypothetical protein LF1_37840 [Rubripirellula obstinata]|uniref:Uncharacterized protein n=1 Tax=Rubripirellula obstinata TaxID=406547 RepID=A0A5B1CJH4_9BACT|nr:hypothetical protein [Rubripirellula obstinata]KAA1261238.1 hypothetical protein LF1_37840 [Rubripirellula obstinata]